MSSSITSVVVRAKSEFRGERVRSAPDFRGLRTSAFSKAAGSFAPISRCPGGIARGIRALRTHTLRSFRAESRRFPRIGFFLPRISPAWASCVQPPNCAASSGPIGRYWPKAKSGTLASQLRWRSGRRRPSRWVRLFRGGIRDFAAGRLNVGRAAEGSAVRSRGMR